MLSKKETWKEIWEKRMQTVWIDIGIICEVACIAAGAALGWKIVTKLFGMFER